MTIKTITDLVEVRAGVLALAHGPLTTPHFTIHEDGSVEQNVALGCPCKTVNVGGCLAGCTDERVIDPACPEHGKKVSDV